MAGQQSIYHSLAVTPVGDKYYINMIALAYLMRISHLPPQCADLSLEMFARFIQTCFLLSTGPYDTARQAMNAVDQLGDALDVFPRLGVN